MTYICECLEAIPDAKCKGGQRDETCTGRPTRTGPKRGGRKRRGGPKHF